MTLRSIVTAGVYASLVPILGATGTWTGSMSAALSPMSGIDFTNSGSAVRTPRNDVMTFLIELNT